MEERGSERMEEDLSGVATQESPASEASVGELVSRASEQLTTPVRDEMRLAQVGIAQKGRRSGIGLGLFGGAGAVAWFGIGSLVTAAILGLSLVVAPWSAAVIVGVVCSSPQALWPWSAGERCHRPRRFSP